MYLKVILYECESMMRSGEMIRSDVRVHELGDADIIPRNILSSPMAVWSGRTVREIKLPKARVSCNPSNRFHGIWCAWFILLLHLLTRPSKSPRSPAPSFPTHLVILHSSSSLLAKALGDATSETRSVARTATSGLFRAMDAIVCCSEDFW